MSCTVPSGIKAPLTTVESALVLKIIGHLSAADSSTLDTLLRRWLRLQLLLTKAKTPINKTMPVAQRLPGRVMRLEMPPSFLKGSSEAGAVAGPSE